MEHNELWLVTTIIELAETLDERQSETAYVSALVARLSEQLAPTEICVLISGNACDLSVMAATSETVDELAALQVRLIEGPCIDSHQTGQAMLNEVISMTDERWPRFAPAAETAGLGIVSVLPIRRREQAIGVFFSAARTHRLTDADLRMLKVLARVSALGIGRQRDLRRSMLAAEQLQRALNSRVLIEQAKGAVAARLGISPDRAFELLRQYARRANLTLADVSNQAIKHALSPYELMAAGQTQRSSNVRAPQVSHS